MEFDVLDSLDDLGYSGVFTDDSDVKAAIEEGAKSIKFTQLVEWLSKELQALCGLESCVNALTDPEDSSSFLLEVSSFLKELHCPYKSLLDGPISQRLLSIENRITLLDYLCTELQTARLLESKKERKNALEIEVDDSSTAVSLVNAMKALDIDVDINNTPIAIFPAIENKLKNLISASPDFVLKPAFKESLTEEQWEVLDSLHKDFLIEYTVRREMLLTRLDVTIQSFKWGDGSKGKENKIFNAYMPLRVKLKKAPSVKLSDILASRESIFILEKTSSAALVKNTKSRINRVLIPAVPDRGGRPKEQRPPVEMMPNWMKRTPTGGGRGDHHGGGWQGHGKKFKGNRRGGGGGQRGGGRGKY